MSVLFASGNGKEIGTHNGKTVQEKFFILFISTILKNAMMLALKS